jgi:hypothetical protein
MSALSKGQNDLHVELTSVSGGMAKLDASLQVQAINHSSLVKLWEMSNQAVLDDVVELKGDVKRIDREIDAHDVALATIEQKLLSEEQARRET